MLNTHKKQCEFRPINCPILYCESKHCDATEKAKLHPAAHHNRIPLRFMNAHLRAKVKLIPLTYVHVNNASFLSGTRTTYFVHNVNLSWEADLGVCSDHHNDENCAPRTPLSIRSWSWLVNLTMRKRTTRTKRTME